MPPSRSGPKHMGPLQPLPSRRMPYGRPQRHDPADEDPAKRPACAEEIENMASQRVGGLREPDEYHGSGWAA